MRVFAILITLSVLFNGCMTSNFTSTGSLFDPLPEDYPIKVILTNSNDSIEYDEIGALQVKQSDMDNLSKAVELAKRKARTKGGDIVFLITSDSRMSLNSYQSVIISEETKSYIFIIGKQKK